MSYMRGAMWEGDLKDAGSFGELQVAEERIFAGESEKIKECTDEKGKKIISTRPIKLAYWCRQERI